MDASSIGSPGAVLSLGLAPFRRLLSLVGWLILRLGPAGSGRALGPLSLWFLWQRLTTRYYGSKPVRPGALLKYAIRRYRGRPLVLADGTTIRSGDRVAALHLDNGALAARLNLDQRSRRATARTWLVIRWAAEDLAVLAEPGRLPPEVKALRGLTILARGGRRLGFEVHELPRSPWNNLVRFFMLGLLTIYNPDGRKRLALVEGDAYPAEAWLSRPAFVERYRPTEKCVATSDK